MSRQLAHYHRKRKTLIEFLGGKCVWCNTLEDLQFDHVDPNKKSFNISKYYGRSLDNLRSELDKCQLLCKSCHNIKTKDIDGFETEHGTLGMYRHQKCRCDLCKKANSDYHAAWRTKKKLDGTLPVGQ